MDSISLLAHFPPLLGALAYTIFMIILFSKRGKYFKIYSQAAVAAMARIREQQLLQLGNDIPRRRTGGSGQHNNHPSPHLWSSFSKQFFSVVFQLFRAYLQKRSFRLQVWVPCHWWARNVWWRKQTMTLQVRTYWWILEEKIWPLVNNHIEQTSHTSLFRVHKEMDGMMDTMRLWLDYTSLNHT